MVPARAMHEPARVHGSGKEEVPPRDMGDRQEH